MIYVSSIEIWLHKIVMNFRMIVKQNYVKEGAYQISNNITYIQQMKALY